MTELLIERDSRGRVSLGRLGEHDRYLAHREPDGRIVLTPAVVLPAHEAALLARPDVVETIRANRAHPEQLRRRKST